MAEIIRTRTIRPSTRLEQSKSYKVDVSKVLKSDTLVVNIYHESRPQVKTFKFSGGDMEKRKSISFKVKEQGKNYSIEWYGDINPVKD